MKIVLKSKRPSSNTNSKYIDNDNDNDSNNDNHDSNDNIDLGGERRPQ